MVKNRLWETKRGVLCANLMGRPNVVRGTMNPTNCVRRYFKPKGMNNR